MNQNSDVSKIPLDVDINCDPVAENVWGFKKQLDGTSIADQQLVANTGYHFDGGVVSLHQNQYSDNNSPSYSYVTEGGNLIELLDAGNDPASNAARNGVYLDGKFLDYVPKNGLESIQAIGGQYDDMILTDANPIGMKVLANQSAVIVSGTGGTSWNARTSTAAAAVAGWRSVTYGNGLFVAVATTTSTSGAVQTSPDGITWTAQTLTTGASGVSGWQSVTYANGIFVAVAATTSTSGAVMTSYNGITWTPRTLTTGASSTGWSSVTYGNGLFVAVASTTSTSGAVMTSPDGITWTAQTLTTGAALTGWKSVTYGNGLFVAVATTTSTSGAVMTSTNGITWNPRTLTTGASSTGWISVTYGNNIFLAIAQSNSTSNTVMTSSDGISWTPQPSTAATGVGWSSVIYANGLFVAVAQTFLTTGAVQTSPDGTSWTPRTLSTAGSGSGWDSVTYANGLFVAVAFTTSTSGAVMTSSVSTSSQLQVRLDEITSTGTVASNVPITLTGAGYTLPVCLVRQALTTTAGFTLASTQYILACDTYTNSTTFTYNIFDQTGQKQLVTSIPVTFAGGKPKNLFAAKMVSLGATATSATDAGKAGYVVVSLGTSGNQTPSYLITNSAATTVAPFTNTNTAMKASWAVMQSKNGYNRVMLTGQPNDSTTTQTLMANIGYTFFTSTYTNNVVPTNTVTATADSTQVPSSSSYAYVDVVHQTDNNHYYSGYAQPTTTYTPFTTQANSVHPVIGFGRLSLINETDNGGIKPAFEFRLVMGKPSSTYGTSPTFISVGQPYSSDSVNVAIGTPISPFGEFDPTFGPQIGLGFNTLIWRWNQVYYIAKISTVPIRPIQKITSNLYKINTISPINVVDVGGRQLLLGSNDYDNTLIMSGGVSASAASFVAATIGWQSYSKTAGSSIDVGGYANSYNSTLASVTVSPIASFTPSCHQVGNYYILNFFAGTGLTSNTQLASWRSDGRSIAATTLTSPASTTLPGLQNQSTGIGSTYISNTTSLPMPLGSRYSGYVIGPNSSATSLAFNETYLSSGYQGTTITTEWDGYILGNAISFNAVSFSLFNQPYLFDGKSIFKINLNGVNLSVPLTVLCRADGLTFMTTSQTFAFFFDSFDNSVWVFDGGYSLKKIKRLDGFGAIQNGNYSPYDSGLLVNTANTLVMYRDGLWTSIPKSAGMIPDSFAGESYMRLYDTVNGTIFGNSFNWWQYQYYAPAAVGTSTTLGIVKNSTIVPLNYQTGYIGPDSNIRMVLSGITFAVYNEFKTATYLQVTIYGYDQDKAYTSSTKTFSIQPADYVNGGIFRAMIQPVQDRLLAASIKFACNTAIRLYDLQYHWTEEAQANISPARSL
jgi:hypothetical protein